jgi:hypothetical protein
MTALRPAPCLQFHPLHLPGSFKSLSVTTRSSLFSVRFYFSFVSSFSIFCCLMFFF